jgi:hypothetical protein
MSQTVAIILRFRKGEVQRFEQLFEAEILPMWKQYKAQGKFLSASLTPVEDGNELKEGVLDYILHVEVPSLAEHEEFDHSAPFLAFLQKARPMQPEEPKVWLGNTLFWV